MDDIIELGRAAGVGGEVVLRRRTDGGCAVDELIVNGVFAMDSIDTTTERHLAAVATGAGQPLHRVLIGGLGLGYTATEFLRLGTQQVEVVEIEASLVVWARAGATPTLARLAADPRVRLHVGDIAAVLLGTAEQPAGPWDAVVLDVDNGPDFLIHADNGTLYTQQVLEPALQLIRPGGTLAIWCQGRAPELFQLCRDLAPGATEHLSEVVRGSRRLEYAIYTMTSPGAPAATPSVRMNP